MEIHVKISGALMMVLAACHFILPRYFNWANDLNTLSLINRQMMYVHTFFIGLAVFLMGLLCFTYANELVGTLFGRRITLGLGVFWTARLFVQFFGYSSSLWKGKRFETMVHIVFTAVWIYFSTALLWSPLEEWL